MFLGRSINVVENMICFLAEMILCFALWLGLGLGLGLGYVPTFTFVLIYLSCPEPPGLGLCYNAGQHGQYLVNHERYIER